MEKVCKTSAVKTSPILLFNFCKYPKTANTCKRLLEISYFKRDHEKGNLIFSFAPSPFYGQDYEKQKGRGTSYLSLWVAKHVYKNSFFALAHWIWKLERKGKKQNIEYLKNEKCLLEEIKTIFHNF